MLLLFLMVVAGGDAELFLETFREVGQRTEPGDVGDLRDGMLPLGEQLGGPVEFVGAEEDAGILAGQALDPIIELRARNLQHLRHPGNVQLGIG